MRTVTIPTPLHAATGRTRIALSVASVAAFPLRLALYYAYPSPPSRPMAAVIRRQSREDHETARAGYEGLLPAVETGRSGGFGLQAGARPRRAPDQP